MSPEQRAWAVVAFGAVVGIVGGWLFTPLSLFVFPVLFVLAFWRYTRRMG